MLTYFPEIYDDELVYSVVARFSFHTGMAATRANTVLFGHALQPSLHDMTTRLNVLVAQIPAQRDVTSTQLIEQHTLFPYYRATMNEAQSNRCLQALKNGKRLAADSAGTGYVISRPSFLRFCAACMREMFEQYGEAYWRRDHQIAAILVCPKHGSILRQSLAPTSGKSLLYHLASKTTCPDTALRLIGEPTDAQRRDLIDLARRNVAILRSGEPIPKDSERWYASFRETCRSKGIVQRDALGDRLMNAVVDRFGFLEPIWPRAFVKKQRQYWLMRPQRRGTRKCGTLHPVAAFLIDRTLEELPNANGPKPFGLGPWECLNPLSGHPGQSVIERAEVSHETSGYYRGVFTCICGCCYTTTAKLDGTRLSEITVRSFGPRLDLYVRWMFDQGYSLNKAVKAAGLTRPALARAAKASGLYGTWIKRTHTRPPKHDNILERFLPYAAGQERAETTLIYGQAKSPVWKHVESDESVMIQGMRPDFGARSLIWKNENRGRYDRSKLRYPSDLTDEEWVHVQSLIPPGGGNRRRVDLREVVNGLLYVLTTGCQLRAIPKGLPPRSTIDGYFDLWDWDGTLTRIHEALFDSQSVKNAEGLLSLHQVTMREKRLTARSVISSSAHKVS
jgi:transposase